ncbi:MAG: cyclic nucleotide-binding domain-containing protein, partial [Alphaproteobacteria bacterium]|nr:cyclic nucleotide-binding domain-containing protein [Alphaproteobacteria bacterium]
MFRQKSITYEIMVKVNGRWQFDAVKTTEAAAVSYAQTLIDAGPHDGVKVVQEEPGRIEQVVFEEDSKPVGGSPVSISSIEYAPLCETTADLYGYEARLCAGRLLRKYLDREGLTPLELLYGPGKFKQLARDDRLMNQAVQKIAGLQAREFDADKSKRVDFLYAAISDLSDPSYKTKPIEEAEAALRSRGLKAAIEVANASSDQNHTLNGAIAKTLSRSLEWRGKLGILLELATGEGDEEILDQAMSEILDGGQAVKEVLSLGDTLKDLILSTIEVIQGKAEHPNLQKLSSLVHSGRYEKTTAVLVRKISLSLGHIQPLTKESSATDQKALEEILALSITSAGFIGDGSYSEAMTKRARITYATDEDLPANQAIDEVLKRLPNKAVALGYLFDLSRTPFAEKYLSEVGAALTRTIGAAKSLKDLCKPNSSPDYMTAVSKDLGNRIEKGGFPEAIGTMIAKNMANLLGGGSGKAAAQQPVETKPITKPKKPKYKSSFGRMRLVEGDIIFNQKEPGDEAYLVDTGRVEIIKISKDGERRIGIVERGEIFGEMALIDQNG